MPNVYMVCKLHDDDDGEELHGEVKYVYDLCGGKWNFIC